MLPLNKLFIFFSLLNASMSLPIISAGITFGTPIYHPIGTSIYYERPYDYYYHDNYYYDGPTSYPYDYAPNYEYINGGFGGLYSSINYSPYIF